MFHVGHNFELAAMANLAHMAEKEILDNFLARKRRNQ